MWIHIVGIIGIDASSIPAMVPKNSRASRYCVSHGSSVSRVQCRWKACSCFFIASAPDGRSSDIGNSTLWTERPSTSLSSSLMRGGTAFQSISIAPKFGWPVVHDLYRQLGFRTRMVVGVNTARSLIIGWKNVGTELSTDWVRPLEVTSYNGYWAPQSNLAISPKWPSPLINITPFLCK